MEWTKDKKAEYHIRQRLEEHEEHADRIHKGELFNVAGCNMPDVLWTGHYAGLSLEAKVLYSFIRRRAFASAEAGFTENGCVFVKMAQQEMAQIIGAKSVNTVKKALRALVAVGLIEVEEQKKTCAVKRIFVRHMFRTDGAPVVDAQKMDAEAAREQHRNYERRTRKVVQKEQKERQAEKMERETLEKFALRLYPLILRQVFDKVPGELYGIRDNGSNFKALNEAFEEAGVYCPIRHDHALALEDHEDMFGISTGWHTMIRINWLEIQEEAEEVGEEEAIKNTAEYILDEIGEDWLEKSMQWTEDQKSPAQKLAEETIKGIEERKKEQRRRKAAETRERNKKAREEAEELTLEEEYEQYRKNKEEEEAIAEWEAAEAEYQAGLEAGTQYDDDDDFLLFYDDEEDY